MAPKGNDSRVDGMEKDLEEMKAGLQHLPMMERTMEQLTQGLSQLSQAMEETQRSLASLAAALLHLGGEKSQEGIAGASSPGEQRSADLEAQRTEKGKWVTDSEEGSCRKPEVVWAPIEKIGGAEYRLGRKLDMPIFNGENPEWWVFRAERYFHLNQLTEEEKLMAAVVCLDGDALAWYGWMETRGAFTSWTEFKIQLLQRFRSSSEGSLCQKILAIRQEGTISEYC